MPRELPATIGLLRCLGLCALALGMAACAGSPGAKSVAEAAGIATTPQDAKDFVTATRREDATYIPVGTVVVRKQKRKTVDEFKKLESDLEARRVSTDAAGSQARTLGKVLPAPKPAEILPTN